MIVGKVLRRTSGYIRYAFNFRRNSYPFLSGDLLADMSDVSLYEAPFRQKPPSKREIADAKVLFCPSDYFERMMDDYGSIIQPSVLILGNSDRDFQSFDVKLPASTKLVLCQNLFHESGIARTLPIGIENLRHGKNGLPRLFLDRHAQSNKKSEVLVGPFGRTHNEREFFFENDLSEIKTLRYVSNRISPKEYARLSSEFRFIASPRGNGLDTHRFWEALYRGSWPVVLESEWSRNIAKLGLPVVHIADWDQLKNFSDLDLSRYQDFNPKDLAPLWWDYWKELIGSYC